MVLDEVDQEELGPVKKYASDTPTDLILGGVANANKYVFCVVT